ncbi:ABC transporter permease [Amycolatopsis rhabdoformis]|uniref:ABC transporter permease n=1 Tax=Amycolatopsis rhabdoformis TaxID=1448059 RepID=A0ABZ1IIT8_9PSEU|nr:ABC transporter permease [Amycolatopsis rhabdoformis]WSE34336.1 ABC transporter permease [Amycolatopsis rhabdoformis]
MTDLDQTVLAGPSGPNATVTLESTPGGRGKHLATQVLKRPTVLVSALILLVVLLAAVWPSLFAGTDPFATSPKDILVPPGSPGFPMGSDAVGRDLFSRVVHGARPSLEAAGMAILVSFLGGALLGLLAGYFGGFVDAVIMRVVDVVLAFPALLLAMAIVAVLGAGPINVAAAVGVVGIASMARVMRSEVVRVRRELFVEAAGLSGAHWWTVLLRHVLPNSLGPIVVLAALELGTSILSISSLSFLGMGAPPPSPEWGALISDGRNYLVSAWWLSAFPGLVVALVVLAANRIARALDGELKA